MPHCWGLFTVGQLNYFCYLNGHNMNALINNWFRHALNKNSYAYQYGIMFNMKAAKKCVTIVVIKDVFAIVVSI